MSVSTLVVSQRRRLVGSLNRFDPSKVESFLQWVDRIPTDVLPHPLLACIPVGRILLFSCIVILPEVICSLIPSITLGGRFWGKGGMYNSIGHFSQFFAFVDCLTLLPVSRRLIGNLLHELNSSS